MSTRLIKLSGGTGPSGTLRALRQRSFALLWAGQTISRLGDSIYRIALAWWVLEHTGSAAAMGSVLIFSFTPMLLFLLIGGVAVDRLPRVPVMLASDVLRGIVVALVALLAGSGTLVIWHVYVASIVFGFVDAFFSPAYQATIPDLLPQEMLPSANALTSLGERMITIFGPPLGAAIVGLRGSALAFGLDSASFFVSTLLLLPLLRVTLPSHRREAQAGVLRDLGAGLRTVVGAPWLWITIAVFALVNVTHGGPYQVALPLLVKELFGARVDALGLIYASAGAGAMLAALWLGRATRLRRRGPLAYGATLVTGLASMAFALPVGLPILLLAGLLQGAGMAIFSMIWVNTLQELVPRDRLGRVISIDMLGSFVLLPVGYGLAGWATDLLGPQQVFLMGGAATVVLIALGLLHPAVRRLD